MPFLIKPRSYDTGAREQVRLALLAVVLTTLGCNKGRDSDQPAVPAAAPIPAIANLSEEECLTYARSVEDAVKKGDADAFNGLVDWQAVINTATDSLGMSARIRNEFSRGAIDSLTGASGFAHQVMNSAARGGSYKMLRVRERGGRSAVLFRLLADDGLNYHEWTLDKTASQVKATDVYVYLAGEPLSETLRRGALPAAQQENKSLLKRLTTAESDFVKHLDEFSQIVDRLRQRRFDEVLQIYSNLPDSLKRDKMMLLMRHQAAAAVNQEELLTTIEEFRKYYPNDVCLDFLLIDYYVLKKEHDKVLACIDRVDKSVGGDPHLNTLRAEAIYQKGDVAEAFRLVEQTIQSAPDQIDAYWTFLGLSLLEKDHSRTLQGLERIAARFPQVDLATIVQSPAYADFNQSPQGKQWQERHGSTGNQVFE